MMDLIYVILFIFAFIIMIYSIRERVPYLALLDSVIWLVFGLFTIKGVDVPTMIYNATTSAYDPYMMTVASDDMTYLSYIWMLLGIIMLVFFITFTLEYLYKGPKEL